MQLNGTVQLGLSAAIKLFIAFIIGTAVVYFLYKGGYVERSKSQMHIFFMLVSMILYGGVCAIWGVFLMLIKLFKPRMVLSPLVCTVLILLFFALFVLVLSIQDMHKFKMQGFFYEKVLLPVFQLWGLGLIYFLIDISGIVDRLFFKKRLA